MNALRILLPALALLLAAAPAPAQEVGVAAAVNQSAQSTRPSSGVRTIGLGDNVVYNERIDTNDVGLVQLLLADGTTFTVGPNSSLVIDSFVYDPDAGTAQVAATLTKGVLRFIGAATSKTENGVAITTPVGVVGIRGGVTDINMSPPAGIPKHISMIFGSSVTLSNGGNVIGRLFEAGYSLALSGGGIDTVKTPPEWSSVIQQALSSSPGQTGGAPQSPTNNTVANSDLDDVNSGDTDPEPPIPQPPLNRPDELGDDLINDVPDTPEERRNPIIVGTGYGAGIITIMQPNGNTPPGLLISPSTPLDHSFITVAFDANGDPVTGELTLVMVNNCQAACAIQLKIDPAGSMLTVLDDNGVVITAPVVADIKDHTDVTLPAGVAYCQCDFLRWGFYIAHGTLTDPVSGLNATVAINNGTWVVAEDFSTVAQLDQLANTTATFNGHAIGTYTDTATNTGPTLTAGDMTLNWAFGTRTGVIDINGFGGRNLTGTLVGDTTFPGFLGNLTDGANAGGLVIGSFVNDGDTIARGVLGDFIAGDGAWTGTGIIMGQR